MADQGAAGAAASAAARQLAAEAREVIAGAAGERVVVLGSLPPDGRDLDLLVSADTRPRLERALSAAGFTARASLHVRFASCTAYAVELIDSGGFLPPEALAELYESAIPLDGDGPLMRPAPPHALLIL